MPKRIAGKEKKNHKVKNLGGHKMTVSVPFEDPRKTSRKTILFKRKFNILIHAGGRKQSTTSMYVCSYEPQQKGKWKKRLNFFL